MRRDIYTIEFREKRQTITVSNDYTQHDVLLCIYSASKHINQNIPNHTNANGDSTMTMLDSRMPFLLLFSPEM